MREHAEVTTSSMVSFAILAETVSISDSGTLSQVRRESEESALTQGLHHAGVSSTLIVPILMMSAALPA